MATADDGTRGNRDQDTHGGSFLGEVKDAVSARAALLMIGVLALTALFIASYAGAFHSPKPKDVALAVVAPSR